jgi:hypothetical protein
MWAAEYGQTACVRALVEAGANKNAKDKVCVGRVESTHFAALFVVVNSAMRAAVAMGGVKLT